MAISSLEFFGHLKWLDGSPLMGHIEDYRTKDIRRDARCPRRGRQTAL